LLLLAIGTGIRIWRWSLGQPLWLDEQMISLNLRDRGLGGLTQKLSFDQSAPLGWLWTQWSVAHTLGTGERALRLIPLLFGIATLVVAWLIGRRWFGPVSTAALVALCAINPSMLRYSAEVKQYSGDTFWVLVLIGLAAWTIEQHARPVRAQAIWWVTAALACLFSMAAVLATPGLAAVILLTTWRRYGRRAALTGTLFVAAWLVAFAVQYAFSLRFALGDTNLTAYWQRFGYPPEHAGPVDLVKWLLRRPGSLAHDPLGITGPAIALCWLAVAAGVLVAARRRLAYGFLLLGPVATGFALGLLRIVPLAGRLALWLVPAVYLAIAVAAEALSRQLVRVWRSHGAPGKARVGIVLASVVALALGGLVVRPAAASAVRRPPQAGGVDDKAAMAFLAGIRHPGDLILVTASAYPAAQWYGTPDIRSAARIVKPVASGPNCTPTTMISVAKGFTRVLAYTGAPSSSTPHRDDILRWRLSEMGRIVQERSFATPGSASLGWVYVVELTTQTLQPLPASLRSAPYTCLAIGHTA
jgi:hypothetical protein